MRRMMTTIAGFGSAVGVCVFISSFVGTTMEKLWPWSVALHIGIFLDLFPVIKGSLRLKISLQLSNFGLISTVPN